MDSSQSSDHRTVSEVVSSEPELPKSGGGAKLQVRADDDKPLLNAVVTEYKLSDVTVEDACKPLSSDVSKSWKSAEVIEWPVAIPHPAVSDTQAVKAVTDNNSVDQRLQDEVVLNENMTHDLVHDDRTLLDTADGKDDEEKSDAESTPRNDVLSVPEDLSVSLDKTLSENQLSLTLASQDGTKLSPVDTECRPPPTELHEIEVPAADVEPTVQQASSMSAVGDADRSMEAIKDLTQPSGSNGRDASLSSHSTRSQHDVQSAGSQPSSMSRAAGSRHSASGASRAGSGSSRVATVDSEHSDRADTVSSRSASRVGSVSSRAHTVDSDRSSRASGIDSNDFNKIVSDDRRVTGRAESTQSNSGGNRADSSVSSKTFTIDSEGRGKVDAIHDASKKSRTASLQHDADVALPDDAVNYSGSELRQQQQQREDVGADTDDDVTDLEADQSLHTKSTENINGVLAVTRITPVEEQDRQEVKLVDEMVNLKDERLPEELDNDDDFNEDLGGSVHSDIDTGNLPRNASETQSDTSESRTGRKSDDLHRIIRKVAAAVESFAREGEHTSAEIHDRDEEAVESFAREGGHISAEIHDRDKEAVPDDRCLKVADGATQNLLADAIDQMLAVRNQKIAAAVSHSTTLPAVPLSPSTLSDSARSTTSNSSDGQVHLVLMIPCLWAFYKYKYLLTLLRPTGRTT